MSCQPSSNPCPSEPCSTQCDPAHEPLPSTVDNFVTQFFGTVTKTCVNNQVVWSLPCNLDTGVPGYPRQPSEGLACYFKRLINDLFVLFSSLGTMAFQDANAVDISGGTITGMPNPTNTSDVATKGYVDGQIALNVPVFNVRTYGAVGDGVTDDTVAVNSAIQAALIGIPDGAGSATRGVVYFPRGNYKITSAIAVTAPADASPFDLQFRGDGAGVSIVTQTTVSANGFVITLTGSSPSVSSSRTVEFKELTIRAGAACGRAIKIDNGTSTSYHKSPGSKLTRVTVESPSTSLYWANGVQFNQCWNAVVDGCFIAGNPTSDAGLTGYGVELTGLCINFTLTNSQLNFWDTGFANINDSTSTSDQNNEGIVLDKLFMVPVRTGVNVKGNPNADFASLGLDWDGRYITGRVAFVSLSNSHIDARGLGGTAPLKLENVNAFMVTSNMFIASSGAANIVYLNQAYEGTFTGNTLFGPCSVGVEVVGKSTNSTFTGNQFRQGGDNNSPTAFQFGTATQFNVATNNTRENQYPLINTDSSTAAGGESNNQVGQTVNISASVTTMGGTSNETFSVDITRASLGRKAPAIPVSLNVVATNIGVLYDWNGIANSKTTARIRVYTLDGTNLPGGTTYRLGLTVNPGTY
jgi:hypothetical protein